MPCRAPLRRATGDRALALPGNLNVWFAFVDAQRVLESLDGRVCLSLGSGCTSKRLDPSHVLRGIGIGNDQARSSMRFGVGRFTTETEIDLAVELVADAVRRQRSTSAVWSAREALAERAARAAKV